MKAANRGKSDRQTVEKAAVGVLLGAKNTLGSRSQTLNLSIHRIKRTESANLDKDQAAICCRAVFRVTVPHQWTTN
ncbi:MAG: hypothetical protein RBJ76_26095 [Stenomitos frigidus ULC029]